MKRSPFRQKGQERRPQATIVGYTPRPRAAAVSVAGPARATVQIPKRVYERDKALLEACRALPCQHCGIQDGTVCAAHSNWGEHGKGMALKADDGQVAALCWLCHAELDQGSRLSKAERRELWMAAHVKTLALLEKT